MSLPDGVVVRLNEYGLKVLHIDREFFRVRQSAPPEEGRGPFARDRLSELLCDLAGVTGAGAVADLELVSSVSLFCGRSGNWVHPFTVPHHEFSLAFSVPRGLAGRVVGSGDYTIAFFFF